MMDINVNSPSDVRAAGMQVLAESLGAVGFARFIQQFENGWGDYTREKQERSAMSFDELDRMLRVHA